MSILKEEIYQQPEILTRLFEQENENLVRLAAQLRDRFEYVIIAARGTSDNAARYAQYLFGARNRLPVSLATPSLYTLYKRPPQLSRALVIAISQSGQSPDIVEVVKTARGQGRPTIAITNDQASPLALAAEFLVPLHAGQERAVAATKSYTTSLGVLAMFSAALADDRDDLVQIENIPPIMQNTITSLEAVLSRVERYRYMQHCAVIGRGFNYATSFEIALKIKELTRVVAEPYSSADFRHGPIAMVRDGFPVLVIAPSGKVFPDLSSLVSTLRKMDSELLIISDKRSLLKLAHLALPLPAGVPEHLTPLVAVIPGQLFSLALSEAKGLDPDHPAGLTKVTETL